MLAIRRRAVAKVDRDAVFAVARITCRYIARLASAEVWAGRVLQAVGVLTATSVVDFTLIDHFATLISEFEARWAFPFEQRNIRSVAFLVDPAIGRHNQACRTQRVGFLREVRGVEVMIPTVIG